MVLRACLVAGAVTAILDALAGGAIGLGPVLLGTAVASTAVQAGRYFVDRRERKLRQRGDLEDRVLVLGEGRSASDLLALIDEHRDCGWRVVGCLGNCAFEAAAHGVAHLGDAAELVDQVRLWRASIVVASADSLRDEAVYARLLGLRRQGVDVRVDAGLRGLAHRDVHPAPLGHDTLLSLDQPRLLGCQRFAKRVLDISLAVIVLTLTAPLLLVSAAAIKLDDRGPVLFRQRRVGRDGTAFLMPKLRSMRVDAEQQLEALKHLNERGGGPLFKVEADPRVTRIGRLLRATSIDELPQLVSVIRGQMSLIGPRPALPSEVVQFDERLASRVEVRPGVTGLWQVEERDNSSFEAYRRLDLYYVENWSLLLDLTILFHTVPAVIGRGWRALHHPTPLGTTATPLALPTTQLEPAGVELPNELIAS